MDETETPKTDLTELREAQEHLDAEDRGELVRAEAAALATAAGGPDVEDARDTVQSSFQEALRDLRDPPDDATPQQITMAALAHILSSPQMQEIMGEATEHDDALLAFAQMMLAMRGGKNVAIVVELPRNPQQGLPAGTIMRRIEQAYRAALSGPPKLDLD